MATVTIVYRKDKINKNGMAPIHFRIIKDRKPKYITSGFMVHSSDWDDVKKRIKGRGKDAETNAMMNCKITERFGEIQRDVIKSESNKRNISPKALRDAVAGDTKSKLFFPFADTVVERYKVSGQYGTYSRTKTVIQKLKDYEPDLLFSDITPQFVAKYEAYLKQGAINPKTNERGRSNSINTVHSNMKFIRQIFNEAYRQDIVELSDNPFLKYKMKTEKTQRVFLSEEELEAFRLADTSHSAPLTLHKDMFVFAAYTGGLRISDMLQLQWKHFDGERIDFTIKKTGGQLSIKVPSKGLEILEKYRPEVQDSNAFIFKSLPYGVLDKGPQKIDNAISGATAYINKNLKTITEIAKLNKHISFHISRHTWATRALRKGVTIDKVSKLMGHAAIKETQVYAKIVNSELDRAMDAFND